MSVLFSYHAIPQFFKVDIYIWSVPSHMSTFNITFAITIYVWTTLLQFDNYVLVINWCNDQAIIYVYRY